VPEELGGSGGNLRDAAVVVAEAARHHVALPIAWCGLGEGGSRPGGYGDWRLGGHGRTAVLDLAVKYAVERVRSGRTLDKFQAVQQLLARLAADATTIGVAADAAVLALPHR